MIGIVDYGVGNLASVRNALDRLGCDAEVFNDPSTIERYERVILPGVGSFRQGMGFLAERGWVEPLRAHGKAGRPLLGICLGMQMLLDEGEEHGVTAGLGLIPGRVLPMSPSLPHRVPHVGWNGLIHTREHSLLKGVKAHVDLYFVHSYRCVPATEEDVVARCDYGGEFVAGVARGNVAGVQFHPEKSQPVGLRVLENFANWDGSC